MGKSYNDIPINDLTATRENVSFLGDVGIKDNDAIYMDLYDGWVGKPGFSNELTLLKLR